MSEQYEDVIGDEALEAGDALEVDADLGDAVSDGTSNT
jgi:hypothetical protein